MILRPVIRERWADVVGYEGLYRISTFGRVRSVTRYVERKCRGGGLRVQRGRYLAIAYNVKSKYPFVALWKDGKQKVVFVHQLILEAFVGPCPTGMECRHLDGNNRRSVLRNLEYGTPQQNSDDKYEHGTRIGRQSLTREEVIQVRKLWATGERTKQELAHGFRVGRTAIHLIVTGRTWRNI